MYYNLLLLPSSETEMELDITAQKKNKAKILVQKKLKAVYALLFSKAVRTYNNQSVSDSISDYLQAIKSSNIPEVYQIVLTVVHDPTESTKQAKLAQKIQKFYKSISNEGYLSVVFASEQTKKKEDILTIYFVPKSEGYASGLMIRSDFIDAVCRLYNISDEESQKMDFTTASDQYLDYLHGYWKDIADNMLSQEELDQSVLSGLDEEQEDVSLSPLQIHAIAADTLKQKLQQYETLQQENQDLQLKMEQEQKRIESSFEWIKQKESEIQRAEKERKRKEEQEKKNKKASFTPEVLSNQKLQEMIQAHLKWMQEFQITTETKLSEISEEILNSPNRLVLENVVIENFHPENEMPLLVGVKLKNCIFKFLQLNILLQQSVIEHCILQGCWITSADLENCQIRRTDLTRIRVENAQIFQTIFEKCVLMDARFLNSNLAAGNNSFINCDCTKAGFSGCDLKTLTFRKSKMIETQFLACDLREAKFEHCEEERCDFKGSITRFFQRE